jgi:RNA polymerase sigma-70 factor (ECF subfamily)
VAVFDFSDDAVLVKALAGRDPDAFAYLLDRYHSTLVHLAQQYVPSRAVAEEVAQETWLAVIEGIDRFEQRSSLKTWLFRILVNIARSHGVKESRSVPFAPRAELDNEPAVDPSRFRRFALRGRGQWKVPPQPWTDPEQHALDTETVSVINRAVDHLPPAQREVLTMRDLVGWSATEVCDALEISDANQRVLLHRARSKVRGALERHFDEPRGEQGGRS